MSIVECEHAEGLIVEGMKSKKCKISHCACFHYDEPEIYAKCPDRKKFKKETK